MVPIQQKIVRWWRLLWLPLFAAGFLLLVSGSRLGAQEEGRWVEKTAVFPPRPNRPFIPPTAAEKAAQQQLNGSINFETSLLQGENNNLPTSLQFGPDGRLYIADLDGAIYVYTIERVGPQNYQVIDSEFIYAIKQIPNHDDDGTPNPNITTRQITGLLVVGTANNPILYVSSSDPRIGGAESYTGEFDTNLDTNSSTISRLTQSSPGSWGNPVKVDLVRGLPRSEENHSINGLALSPDGQTLYAAIAGSTNMGAPSTNFAELPEYALAAAIVSVDLAAIGDSTYDLPTLDDPTRGGAGQPPENDPFGGNDGLNQAKLVPGGPVQIYASGFRNPYDVVIRKDGRFFTIDNGPNAGWGAPPHDEGPGGDCTNALRDGGDSFGDGLHYISGAGYYGGHPNPARGNPQGVFGDEANTAVPFALANPVECDYRQPGFNGALAMWATSTNGLVEYTASNFDGDMQGDLLAAGWNSENIYRVKLSFDQNDVPTVDLSTVLFSAVGGSPLDVTAQGDEAIFPGTIWVASLWSGGIRVYEPNAPAECSGADSPALDEDSDGFSNADELDNGTDPCNAANRPADADGDFVSDLNDPDDDNDGSNDMGDLFAIDPFNGTATHAPVSFTWDNDGSNPGGLLGLGFTGLMSNGSSDYLTLFDPGNMTAGGAGGLMTIDQVPDGTALGGSNNQAYGFQFGVATDTSLPLTAHTRLLNPFSGQTPQDNQALGLFVGRGDQDNFVALLVAANGGVGGVALVQEVGGVTTSSQLFGPDAGIAPLGSTVVDLYLQVDPLTQMVQASYARDGGTRQPLGDPLAIPADWLTADGALAVGVMATSSGPAEPFTATWDRIDVWQEPPGSVGAWTAVSANNEPTARHENGFVQFEGKFYLLGGRGSKPVEIYDPVTNQWSQGATPPLEMHHFQAFVYEEQIAVVGGYTGACCNSEFGLSHLYFYHPANDSWTQGAEIPTARRRGSGGSVLYNGKFYWVGGLEGGHGEPATSYAWFDEFDPVTGQWTVLPDAPRPRDHFQAAVVGGKLYLIGGRDGSDPSLFNATIAEVDVYDFATGQWATLPASANLPTPRAGTTTAVLGSEIIIIGGESQAQTAAHAEAEAFDTRSQTWRTLAPLQQGRHGTQAAVCNEGLTIVAGSANRGGGPEMTQLEQFFFGAARPCATDTPPMAPGVRVNAGGGDLVGKDGRLWQSDRYFSGGQTYVGAGVVGNSEDDELYLSERYGAFSYEVPVSNGCYQIELHFAEIFWAEPDKRLFDVAIEGETVLQNYDIFAAAGGQYRAVVERQQVEVVDGTLNIAFHSVLENAKVSAVAVMPLGCVEPPVGYSVYLPLVLRG